MLNPIKSWNHSYMYFRRICFYLSSTETSYYSFFNSFTLWNSEHVLKITFFGFIATAMILVCSISIHLLNFLLYARKACPHVFLENKLLVIWIHWTSFMSLFPFITSLVSTYTAVSACTINVLILLVIITRLHRFYLLMLIHYLLEFCTDVNLGGNPKLSAWTSST